MTSVIRRVPLTALPSGAAAALKRFLFAYELTDSGRFVIRHADPTDNRIEELEFDPRLNRFLSADERLGLRASEPRAFRLPSGQIVRVSYRVQPDRNSLVAHYEVPADGITKPALEVEQELYAPIQSEPIAAITQALARERFPVEYARWDEARKVTYWATTLHRLRRANGESGREEDDVFTPALLRDMEQTDPFVRRILKPILRELAGLAQVDPQELESTFVQRVGLSVRSP